jgi:hypothetical protein
MLLQSFDR